MLSEKVRMRVLIATAVMLSGCGVTDSPGNEPEGSPEASLPSGWPSSLKAVGDGFPTPGAACRIVGESEATVNLLDDSATLVGCPTEAEAAKLGGRIMTNVDGITLVSVPSNAGLQSPVGDGDDQGDAKVAGTDYNATAEIKCAGYRKHPAGTCPAGVKRNGEGGMTIVEIKWPAGESRTLFFDKGGKLVTADTSQVDGSAAFQPKGVKQSDTTIVTIGPERYEIPDVFVLGD
jgi:hypothetical protein